MRHRAPLLLAIAAVLGLLTWFGRPVAPTAGRPHSTNAPAAGAAAAESVGGPTPRATMSPAAVDPDGVPASANPLLAALQALDARSRTGDVAATLELMREAQRCLFALRVDQLREHFDSLQRYGQLPGSLNLAANQQQLEQAYALWTDAGESARCAGLPPDWLDQEFEWLLRLAEQGDLQAQLRFVLDPPLSRRTALADIDRIQRYRQRAPMLLQRAFEQGSVDALMAMLDQQAPIPDRVWIAAQFSFQSGHREADPPLLTLPRHVRMSSIQIAPVHRQLPTTADPLRALALAELCLSVCADPEWLAHAQTVRDRLRTELDSGAVLQAGSHSRQWKLQHFSRAAPRPVLSWSGRWGR